jgi:hypothetical protein
VYAASPSAEAGGYFWDVPSGHGSGVSPGAGETYARRSEEKAVIEEKLRHSGLDPESRIVFSGAKRRKNLIDELNFGSSPE